MPRLSAAQLEAKRSTIGASDFPVIAGVSPWRTPFELYLELIGELDREAATSDGDRARQERGHRFEDVALAWYAEERGISIERIHRDIRHPRMPFVIVHPDARVRPWRSTKRLAEAKTGYRRWDEVPQHVEAQVQAQMAAAGADVVDVVLQTFDGPPYVYEVERNDELIAALEDLVRAFWDRVQRRDAPPIDGSRAASRWLDRMFLEGPEVVANKDQSRILARLLEIRAVVKGLEAEDDELVNVLKFSLAGSSRMYAPGVGKVLWTAPSERRTTAWKEVATAYRQALLEVAAHDSWIANQVVPHLEDRPFTEDLDAIEGLYTTVAEGIRQFRVTPAKERGAHAA
jgi:putative phage-type endonuclease